MHAFIAAYISSNKSICQIHKCKYLQRVIEKLTKYFFGVCTSGFNHYICIPQHLKWNLYFQQLKKTWNIKSFFLSFFFFVSIGSGEKIENTMEAFTQWVSLLLYLFFFYSSLLFSTLTICLSHHMIVLSLWALRCWRWTFTSHWMAVLWFHMIITFWEKQDMTKQYRLLDLR